MKYLLRFVLACALAWLPIGEASAASGLTQITVKDAGGTNRNINVTSDTGAITGNLMWNNVWCDPTTTTQCATVDSSGRLTALAVQSGTWNITNISGTISLPTGAASSSNQTTALSILGNSNAGTVAHTCSTAGYSILSCAGQMDDDIKLPLAAGAAVIGGIFGSPNVTATDCSIALTTGDTAQNIISA